MRLTVVGCSGSFPGPDSAASCYLLEATGDDGRTWRVLLDLGSGALGPLQRYTRLPDLDAVLFSHLHADHCLDLCGLYVALRYDPAGQSPERVPVYGPADTARRMACAYDLPSEPGMSTEFDFRSWTDAQPVDVGPLRITPRLVRHPVEAYAMRVQGPAEDGGTGVLVYTGDTDTCPALVEASRDADVLLAEAAFLEGRDTDRGIHLTGRRAGELAAEAGARSLVLTHLPPWNDSAATLAEAVEVFSGPVDLARTGAVHRI